MFKTSELISSLAKYSQSHQSSTIEADGRISNVYKTSSEATYDAVSSVLLLHIQAAADYFTTNRTLMENAPPVFVDIILDPFLLNVLPQSLLPTVGYIIVLAIGSWFLSKHISSWVITLAKGDMDVQKKTS